MSYHVIKKPLEIFFCMCCILSLRKRNTMKAVDINGYVSSYSYDAGGERVTKMSGGGQGIFVNSVFSGGKTSTSDFTLYVNPYLVAQNGGRYTKHIYIGSQRIVSKLGDFDSYGADPRRVEKAGESFSGVKVDYDTKYKKSLETVKANYASLDVPYYGLDNNDYVNGLGFCCNPSGGTTSGGSSTWKMTGKNDNAELQQFYYHPDHLGSSSYISNLDGEVVQHIEYVPFGEVFLEEKNAKWNTPYLFTSKELDKETGMYYFGARYQDPKLGIFISVDPLAEKYKGVSSYAYALNNPVKFIDPDGRSPFDWISYVGQSGQQQVIYDETVKSRQQAEAKYKNVTDVFKSGSITGAAPDGNTSYSYQLNGNGSVTNVFTNESIEKGFTTPQGTYIGENIDHFGKLASLASNSGDVAVVVGTVMVFTGVGAPIGAGLITYGGYLSTAGTIAELTNDASNGNLTKEKFITKTAMLAVPEVGGAALKSLGAPAAKNLFNLETMAVDKSLDLMREAKTGPYNEN